MTRREVPNPHRISSSRQQCCLGCYRRLQLPSDKWGLSRQIEFFFVGKYN